MKKIISVITTVLLLLGSFGMSGVYAAPTYSDNVAPLLSELKIMQGDPDGNMRLNDFVSRAECTKIAVASSKYRDKVAIGSKTSPFKDVPAEHWGAPYITIAVKNGLCKGYLDATFKPGDTVTYEEALTMFLRVLDYSEDDFGSSWPDGQIGIAKNIGLCDDLSKTTGEALTRRDIMIIVYNLLNTPAKNSANVYLSEFDRTITDDVILIASSNESSAVDTGKVATSVGTYKITDNFNYDNIGKRGSIVLRNNDTIVSFIPSENSNKEKKTVVYSVLDNDIVTYNNGNFDKLNLTTDTVFYKDNTKTTYSAISQKIEMGDILKVNYKSNGNIDYIVYEEGKMNGPVTVSGSSWYAVFNINPDSTTIMRDGSKTTLSGLKTNDIAYYSEDLNMILTYSKKITGIYESATPNKDTPTSVTVSGTTYKIEGINAFTKLSSSGNFQYGDTVTLLLGKTGEVADVLSQSQQSEEVYGYLVETGTKETIVDNSTVTKHFARVVLPSGNNYEYIADKDYKSILNQPVKVSFTNGTSKLTVIPDQSAVSGTFTWNSTTHTIGNSKLDTTLNIIEVSTTNPGDSGKAASVFPQRLNGLSFSASDILYVGKNSEGKITDLIIVDSTGDMHSYGIITSATKNTNGMNISGNYTYLLNGNSKTITTNGSAFSVSNGQAVKIKTSENGSVIGMSSLTKLSDNKINNITESTISYGGKIYKMSDDISVYTKDSSYNYSMLTLDEFKNTYENYTVSLYCDKAESIGGRIRIIVAIKK